MNKQNWLLDPHLNFLNHGSFGACPLPILEYQRYLQEKIEKDPVHFLLGELEGLLDEAREDLGKFLHAQSDHLVFVANATTGVNTVLRSLDFQPQDELLTTNHEYNACRNALEFVANRTGAKIVVADVPFPLTSSQQVLKAILEKVSPQTKLALISHVTSPTALIFPINDIVRELALLGIDTLVDGAHAPGLLLVDLKDLKPAYYTGNCHKWLCAPKGSGFLYVREDKQSAIHPLSISHGANSPRSNRSRFLLEFDWTGTNDYTPYLCIAKAISLMNSLLPGGWDELMENNRHLALTAREKMCQILEQPLPSPGEMIGAMASIILPERLSNLYLCADDLQKKLKEFDFQVPIIPWFPSPNKFVRISAQCYNQLEQYENLAQLIKKLTN